MKKPKQKYLDLSDWDKAQRQLEQYIEDECRTDRFKKASEELWLERKRKQVEELRPKPIRPGS